MPRSASPAVSPRLLRVVAPFLVLLTGAFAVYQLFLAGVALKVRSYPFALFYAVMGVAGLAIATALRRTLKARR
jgi:hypothetical protein